jgi:hypothetical protein
MNNGTRTLASYGTSFRGVAVIAQFETVVGGDDDPFGTPRRSRQEPLDELRKAIVHGLQRSLILGTHPAARAEAVLEVPLVL